MLLFVAIWLVTLTLGIATMQLAFLIGRTTHHRHLGACIEASKKAGTNPFHDRLCEIATGAER